MMVTFVSQCEKNALKKTRRVLDAFANRIGDNTWQTVITQEGLFTVKRMLSKTASRSTAVSCHWIRSRSRSQFLWVVGNKSKFNQEGVVPVNRTEKDLLNQEYESNWKYLPLIKSFTTLAALLHDWGKATLLFQDKLNPKSKHKFKGDPLRHEWISTLLFCALVKTTAEPGSDQAWLAVLLNQSLDEEQLERFVPQIHQQGGVLAHLPDAAAILIWLILSHHRLPLPKNCTTYLDRSNTSIQSLLEKVDQQWGYENRHDEQDYQQRIQRCFKFPQGLLGRSEKWLKELSFWANQLQQQLPLLNQAMSDGSWRTIAHHARLCLMLGDHYYSSQDKALHWHSDIDLYANTDKHGKLKQKLDEHLVKVAETATNAARLLPFFESEPLLAQDIQTLQSQKNVPPEIKKNFGWQDKAVTKIQQYRQDNDDSISGFFLVNMASTGKGKTLANAKMMQVLSDDQQSLRFILALGLRTLTLQTGDEYRERVGLNEAELAVLIGSKAILELHKGERVQPVDEQDSPFAESGSESQELLLAQDDNLDWYGQQGVQHWQNVLPETELSTVLRNHKDRAFLHAPVLACTIDHIISATETKRGGRYILPCLRLMSSDLVIDEIDDFVGDDLVAIGRLIYLAGMLGRKVMISSATVPPDMALSFFAAYQRGWQSHALSRDVNRQIGCVWVDEFKTELVTVSHGEQAVKNYQSHHQAFIEQRDKKIKQQVVQRKANIERLPVLAVGEDKRQPYFSTIQQAIYAKHLHHHTLDEATGRLVSFGVVRCANILPCIALTQYFLKADWQEDIEVRVMAYHSQQVLLLRHEQETHLDKVLKRKDSTPQAFQDPDIRKHLNNSLAKHVIFILVATPVEEIGRDHDFDWAVVEPSSYRSIIQLVGRVRRHRRDAVDIAEPNVALLQYNWKGYQGRSDLVFTRPGYESEKWKLNSHNLLDLVNEKHLLRGVNAIPRIKKDISVDHHSDLAALEHYATAQTLGCDYLLSVGESHSRPRSNPRRRQSLRIGNNPKTLWGYTDEYWWMTALPQHFKSFRSSSPSLKLYLIEDERKGSQFKVYDAHTREWIKVEKKLGISHQPLPESVMKRLWLVRDYRQSAIRKSEELGVDVNVISKRFGEISLSYYQDGQHYRYDDQLGIRKEDDD